MRRDAIKYMEEKKEKEKKEKEKKEKEKKEKEKKEKEKKEKEKKNKQSRTQNTTRRRINVSNPQPILNRDLNPILDMGGNYLPPEFRFNTPSYDIASGRYINQGKYSVKCWTRYNKTGNPYTTCYNNDYEQQLRRGQPPRGARGRKPTVSQLKKKKKELRNYDNFIDDLYREFNA